MEENIVKFKSYTNNVIKYRNKEETKYRQKRN